MRFLALYETTDPRDCERVRTAIRRFLKLGPGVPETHSANGLLLHRICNHLVESRIPFDLRFDPTGNRYLLTRLA